MSETKPISDEDLKRLDALWDSVQCPTARDAVEMWNAYAPLRARIAQQAARLEAAERGMKSLGRHNRALVEASKAQAQQIETARDNIDQHVDRITELERLLMIERGRNDDLLSRNKAQAGRIAELEKVSQAAVGTADLRRDLENEDWLEG